MMETVRANSPRAFIKAFRIKTLGAIACPILLGQALAIKHGSWSLFWFLITISCGLLLQILANVVNDYGDFLRGGDSRERLGPERAMQMGWVTKPYMEMMIALLLVAITFLGSLLVYRAGIFIALLGLLSISLCLWYTLGRKPLSYLGFVEVVVFFVFGPLAVAGAYYVQTKELNIEPLIFGITPGLLSAALLLTNNVRDLMEDKKNHKLTTAVRLGERFSRWLIVALTVSAPVSPVVLYLAFDHSTHLIWACLPAILPARHLPMILFEPVSKRFNLLLASIGHSLYLYGLFVSLGIICGIH